MTETPRTGRSAKMIAAAVVVGLMGSGALVWQASSAAFTATTENDGNTWDSGKVLLSDNDSDAAMFEVTDLVPLQGGTHCLDVEYDGDVTSTVKVYAEDAAGTLGQYLDFDIELGAAGATCLVPTTWSQIVGDAGTTVVGGDMLSTFTTARTDFSNGVAGWQPTGVNQARPYRFTWKLHDTNAAQDQDAAVKIVWEAQNN